MKKHFPLLATMLCIALLPISLSGCAQSPQTEEPASQTTGESQPQQEQADQDQKIEVKVVDTATETSSNSSDTATTTFSYDENGRLVSSEATNASTPMSGFVNTFSYDDKGRLSSIVTSAEYIGWNDSQQQVFTYDESGNCISFSSEVLSQGDGAQLFEYAYDEQGRPTSATNIMFRGGLDGFVTEELFLQWAYTPDDHVKSYVSPDGSYPNYQLDSSEDEMAQGIYRYVSHGNAGTYFTEIHCSPDGLVEQIIETSSYIARTTTYTYKTISVEADSYIPTIFSNPTGLPTQMKPQLTQADALAIKGE